MRHASASRAESQRVPAAGTPPGGSCAANPGRPTPGPQPPSHRIRRPSSRTGGAGDGWSIEVRLDAAKDGSATRCHSSGRLRRRHADKPALYSQIRAAAATGEPATSELAARFRVCHRTVTKALAAPEPPPWKQPFKKQPPAYAASLDALLDTAPHLTARQLWEQLTDHTDLKVSYDTVSEHHKRRQQAQPRT